VTRCTHPCQKSNSAAVEGRKRGGDTEIGLWDKGTCGEIKCGQLKDLCVDGPLFLFYVRLDRIGGLAVLDPAWGSLAKRTG